MINRQVSLKLRPLNSGRVGPLSGSLPLDHSDFSQPDCKSLLEHTIRVLTTCFIFRGHSCPRRYNETGAAMVYYHTIIYVLSKALPLGYPSAKAPHNTSTHSFSISQVGWDELIPDRKTRRRTLLRNGPHSRLLDFLLSNRARPI